MTTHTITLTESETRLLKNLLDETTVESVLGVLNNSPDYLRVRRPIANAILNKLPKKDTPFPATHRDSPAYELGRRDRTHRGWSINEYKFTKQEQTAYRRGWNDFVRTQPAPRRTFS